MGASNSKLEEDKSLQLCRARKKYVKKALNGRCLLADTHIAYIQSLRSTGSALRVFFELEGLIESSFRTTTDVTSEPLARGEKNASGLSFSSISDARSPSFFSFRETQATHKKFERSVSQKIEVKVDLTDTERVRPSNATQSTKQQSVSASSPLPGESSPWDYFHLSHPLDAKISAQTRGDWDGLKSEDDTRSINTEDERILNDTIIGSEDDDEKNCVHEREDSDEFFKDFNQPVSKGLLGSFESTNMASDITGTESSPSIASASNEISEMMLKGRNISPHLSPLGTLASSVSAPANLKKLVDVKEAEMEGIITDSTGSKASPKDLCSSMKYIDRLFMEASEAGLEVPRMLEANKLHFRPKLQKSKGAISRWLNVFISCQEGTNQVPEDSAPDNTRYLTWQKTMSARTFSSVNAAVQNARDDNGLDNSFSDPYYMKSGSHASTLDRLYAWEKKLYDEVKVCQVVRNAYDMKCKLLRDQESRGEPAHRIDKTRVVIKDLHSRIRVSIKRMESISRQIEEIRDKELEPQLEELVKGLGNMWEMMHRCHKLQFEIISVALSNGNKIAINSDSHQQITNRLEQQLNLMHSNFTKWIAAHKAYLQAIDGWLLKCVIFPEKTSRKKRRHQPVSFRGYGPPIFTTCGVWLEKLEKLPTKGLADSIRCLAAETSRLLPRQEKHHGDHNLMNTFYPAGKSLKATDTNVWRSDFDNFHSILVQFFSQLNLFSESAVIMHRELDTSIQEAKRNYEQLLKPYA